MVLTNTLNRINLISATPPTLNVQFIAAPTIGYTPLVVRCTDQTVGPTQDTREWRWDFGYPNAAAGPTYDEIQDHSVLQHPTHVYKEIGTYNVQLSVSSNVAPTPQSLIKNSYITVLPTPPSIEEYNITDMEILCTLYMAPSTLVVGGFKNYVDDPGLSPATGCIKVSTNYGEYWSATVALPTAKVITHLCRTNVGHLIAVGTDWNLNTGIWKSTDIGSTWTLAATLSAISQASITKANTGTLLITNRAGANNIYRSIDNGSTWAATTYGNPSLPSMIAVCNSNNTLTVVDWSSEWWIYCYLWNSTDDGITWSQVGAYFYKHVSRPLIFYTIGDVGVHTNDEWNFYGGYLYEDNFASIVGGFSIYLENDTVTGVQHINDMVYFVVSNIDSGSYIYTGHAVGYAPLYIITGDLPIYCNDGYDITPNQFFIAGKGGDLILARLHKFIVVHTTG